MYVRHYERSRTRWAHSVCRDQRNGKIHPIWITKSIFYEPVGSRSYLCFRKTATKERPTLLVCHNIFNRLPLSVCCYHHYYYIMSLAPSPSSQEKRASWPHEGDIKRDKLMLTWTTQKEWKKKRDRKDWGYPIIVRGKRPATAAAAIIFPICRGALQSPSSTYSTYP